MLPRFVFARRARDRSRALPHSSARPPRRGPAAPEPRRGCRAAPDCAASRPARRGRAPRSCARRARARGSRCPRRRARTARRPAARARSAGRRAPRPRSHRARPSDGDEHAHERHVAVAVGEALGSDLDQADHGHERAEEPEPAHREVAAARAQRRAVIATSPAHVAATAAGDQGSPPSSGAYGCGYRSRGRWARTRARDSGNRRPPAFARRSASDSSGAFARASCCDANATAQAAADSANSGSFSTEQPARRRAAAASSRAATARTAASRAWAWRRAPPRTRAASPA